MRTLDKCLLSPSREQLADELRSAVEFANARVRCHLLPWPLSGLDDALDGYDADAGVRRWSGFEEAANAGFSHAWPEVGFAWWSDPLHRKHVRILANRCMFGSSESFPPFWKGSPLAYIAPRSVALIERQGERRRLVFCSCGEHGTPEALGWMGDRCGPCHDRAEEGMSPAPCWPLSLPGSGEVAMLFAPGGELVVARGQRIALQDLDGGQTLWEDDCPHLAWMGRLVCSPDGRWLAFPARNHAVVWELATGRRLGVAQQPHMEANELLLAVIFTPDNSRLIVLSRHHLTVWAVGEQELRHERTTETGDTEARSLLISPDGRNLLVGMRSGVIRRWSLATWRASRWSLTSPSGVTFMAAQGPVLLAADGHQGVIHLCDLDTRKVIATVRGTSRLTLTPDRRIFLAPSMEVNGGYLFSDFASGRPLARLWFPSQGGCGALSISPDGRTLAVARFTDLARFPMSLFGLADEGRQR